MSKQSSKKSLSDKAMMGPFLPAGIKVADMQESHINRLARQAIEGTSRPKAP